MEIILNIVGALLAIIGSAVAGWLYTKSLKGIEVTPKTISKTENTKKIRILVVDDESVVREGITAILSLSTNFQIVGEAENGVEAIKLVEETKPDVILLDMIMPEMDGLTAIPKIMEKHPNAKILVLTSFAESNRVYQAIKDGALGYLLKDTTRKELLKAIIDVANGKATIQPEIAGAMIQQISQNSKQVFSPETLTAREIEILKFIARGLSNEEIANELHLHERTIAKNVAKILEKLHVANRTQAALYAIREGITENDK